MEQYKGMGKSIRKASHLYSEWLSIESSTHGGRRRVVRGQAGREEAICSSKWGGSVVGEHLASRSHQGDHCEKIKMKILYTFYLTVFKCGPAQSYSRVNFQLLAFSFLYGNLFILSMNLYLY